jgi:ABC-2 type transport system ATP-binding protein
MRDGKLLAMDTPAALKNRVVAGNVWEVHAEPLLEALEACGKCEGILQVGLAGDHLRIVAEKGKKEKDLRLGLRSAGLIVQSLAPCEPTLEDVFLTLAKK